MNQRCNYTSEDMLVFARVASAGGYGDYKGCHTLKRKLERFKSLNKIEGTIMENSEKEKSIAIVEKYNIISKVTWYHITIDGNHVEETFTSKLDEAKEMFEKLVDNNGEFEIIKVVQEATFFKGKVVDKM